MNSIFATYHKHLLVSLLRTTLLLSQGILKLFRFCNKSSIWVIYEIKSNKKYIVLTWNWYETYISDEHLFLVHAVFLLCKLKSEVNVLDLNLYCSFVFLAEPSWLSLSELSRSIYTYCIQTLYVLYRYVRWSVLLAPISEIIHLLNYYYLAIFSYVPSLVHSWIHWSIHSLIHPFINPCIHPFIHQFIHLSIHPSIHWLIHSFIHWFARSFIHSSIHSFIHLPNKPNHFFTQPISGNILKPLNPLTLPSNILL
jgi:hypothetical protein